MRTSSAVLSLVLCAMALSPSLLLSTVTPARAQATMALGIFSPTRLTASVVDPLLTPGAIFNIDVTVTDAPPIVNSKSGGVNAFDITVVYNTTILKSTDVSYQASLCPTSEGCLFAQNAFEVHKLTGN